MLLACLATKWSDSLSHKADGKKLMLKKARIQAIVIGMAAVIAVLFMVYGFTQSIEAGRQRDLSLFAKEESQKEISTLKEQLARCESEKNK